MGREVHTVLGETSVKRGEPGEVRGGKEVDGGGLRIFVWRLCRTDQQIYENTICDADKC